MKNWILRASAMAFAAGLAGTLACGGGASSCGGTNINANSTPTTFTNQCGAGTYLSGTTCLPLPSGNSNSSSAPSSTVITN